VANKGKPERLDFIEGEDGTPAGRIACEDTSECREPYDFIDLTGEQLVPPKAFPDSRHWQNMRLVTRGEASNVVVRRMIVVLIQIGVVSIIFFLLLRNVKCEGFTL
jgi:hypothetical protein